MLSSIQRARYVKQIPLAGFGEAGQLSLSAASVLVIGAGGLGCPVLQYLAAAGVGIIGVADFDKVEISNLQRQVLYSEIDVNELKCEVAKSKIQALNPLINVNSHQLKVSHDNSISLIEGYDIIVDCTDNFDARYLISDACVIKGKTLIYGSIYRNEGQLSVFNHKNGPTYRCLFQEPDNTLNCNDGGVLGVLPGIIGTLMANEVIKVILNSDGVLSGILLVFDLITAETTKYKFAAVEANKRITALQTLSRF